MAEQAEILLVKLAALKESVDARIVSGISMTGVSLSHTREYLDRYAGYRNELRRASPDLFGDFAEIEGWHLSIAEQKAMLRQASSEIHEILARGAHAGLWQPLAQPMSLANSPPAERSEERSWISEHVWLVVVAVIAGLIVAYLGFRFGWNR